MLHLGLYSARLLGCAAASRRWLLMLLAVVAAVPVWARDVDNGIVGETFVLPEDMCSFVQRHNPAFTLEIAEAYWDVAELYGIRGDVALCQAIIETGWFKFMDGTAVTPDQFNFCGLGVTAKGMKGNSFNSIIEGVTAQIQHLFAYATVRNIPEGETLVDGRFKLVSRGCAPTWQGLSGRWAASKTYGDDIMRLYRQMQMHSSGSYALGD
ncbi:MAG: glucosaminidase domain-containing protein [Candidatus Amulumruptor caecigallinarius]|nr:glucosaminidase domain-containing protein [Candidatus Amulumruptor caecigallinarius]MCM1397736.1 glucosaminidase domain-containing protein [Candidatus Amulumruptor caecigallinarius]MCM1454614.1 glucosaminidase domain-containing protein [bacterium]